MKMFASSLPARTTFCSRDELGSFARDLVAFDMNFVVFEGCGVHWLKGAQANVEREFTNLAAAHADSIEDLRSEMQARGWCCDCARLRRENGLITLAIVEVIGTIDVRRQWHVPK